MSIQDIEATIGIYRDNLGKESNAQSGRAILSRQREGDVGTFLYMDNLAEAVCQAGRILVDMIPRVYDTQRTIRILGEDGKEEFAQINVTDPATGQKFNDLSVGRYDVVPSVGPSFSTRREEARESMMAFFQAQPQAAAIAGDIVAKTMDWPGAEEFAKRMRRMALMQGMIEPDQQNPDDMKIVQGMQQQGQKPDPNALLAQAEMEKAKAAQMKAQSDAMIAVEKLKTDRAKIMLDAMRAEVEAKQAGVKLSIQAADVMSRVAERKAGMMRDGIAATMDTVERMMQATYAPPGKAAGDMPDAEDNPEDQQQPPMPMHGGMHNGMMPRA